MEERECLVIGYALVESVWVLTTGFGGRERQQLIVEPLLTVSQSKEA